MTHSTLSEHLRETTVGCRILESGYWILDTGCWILDTGYWILILDVGDTRYWRSGY